MASHGNVKTVTGWQTSDGVVHKRFSDAQRQQFRLDVEKLADAVPYTDLREAAIEFVVDHVAEIENLISLYYGVEKDDDEGQD